MGLPRNARALRSLVPALVAVLALTAGTVSTGAAASQPSVDPVPLDISARLKNRKAPAQPTAAQAQQAVAAGPTTASRCFGDDETLTIRITSFDPANPGAQDVVFFKETAAGATGKATLWVAWDFLETAFGRQDAISCDQLAYLQGQMDKIVASDTKYFGDYVRRPAGNENIDVMIYNIVDESYFDPTFASYIAGFFWSSVNDEFNRNMIFVDSYDWSNRLGPDVRRPYLYEGTVAHELEHLIHNDHDMDEESWVDEGMADLAIYLAGYGHSDSHVVYYLAFHRKPLTIWGGGLEDYGASYLFQLYLLENFDQTNGGVWDPGWTRTLIDEQGNGIQGIEEATGEPFTPLFDSWVLANYLDNKALHGPGGYPLGYSTIDLAPYHSRVNGDWSIRRSVSDIYGSTHKGNLPVSRYFGGYTSGTVEYPIFDVGPYAPVYGTYRGMEPLLNVKLRAPAQSGVAPSAGTYEAASGGGNMLTDRMLRLNVPVGGTLTFKTWFDIEENWDFGFVEASTDGGHTWAPLVGNVTRHSDNPFNSTAWKNSPVAGQASTDAAFTGNSGGWVDASFALPAANDVLVRFAYYTDEATNGQGWFVDDVATTTGFSDGFESGSADWTLGGWGVTTGLFANHWAVGYVNPVYANGKLSTVDAGYLPSITGSVDTSRLNNDEAVVVFTNRAGDSPFSSRATLLVDKGTASGR